MSAGPSIGLERYTAGNQILAKVLRQTKLNRGHKETSQGDGSCLEAVPQNFWAFKAEMDDNQDWQESQKNYHLVPGMKSEATYKAFIKKKNFEQLWKLYWFPELGSSSVIQPAAFSVPDDPSLTGLSK